MKFYTRKVGFMQQVEVYQIMSPTQQYAAKVIWTLNSFEDNVNFMASSKTKNFLLSKPVIDRADFTT